MSFEQEVLCKEVPLIKLQASATILEDEVNETKEDDNLLSVNNRKHRHHPSSGNVMFQSQADLEAAGVATYLANIKGRHSHRSSSNVSSGAMRNLQLELSEMKAQNESLMRMLQNVQTPSSVNSDELITELKHMREANADLQHQLLDTVSLLRQQQPSENSSEVAALKREIADLKKQLNSPPTKKNVSHSPSFDSNVQTANASYITPEEQQKTQEIMDAQAELPEVEGFLKKKSPRVIKGWQRRYIVVKDYNIYYSKDQITIDDSSIRSDSDIHCVSLIVVSSIGHDTFAPKDTSKFEVQAREPHSGKLRSYRFQASCEAERNRWEQGLTAHKNHLTRMMEWASDHKHIQLINI